MTRRYRYELFLEVHMGIFLTNCIILVCILLYNLGNSKCRNSVSANCGDYVGCVLALSEEGAAQNTQWYFVKAIITMCHVASANKVLR